MSATIVDYRVPSPTTDASLLLGERFSNSIKWSDLDEYEESNTFPTVSNNQVLSCKGLLKKNSPGLSLICDLDDKECNNVSLHVVQTPMDKDSNSISNQSEELSRENEADLEIISPRGLRRRSSSWLICDFISSNSKYKHLCESFWSNMSNASIVCLSIDDYEHKIASIVKEFFVSFDCIEATRSMMELELPSILFDKKLALIKKCVEMSLDYHDKEREAISQLLIVLHDFGVVSRKDVQRTFQEFLKSGFLEDLALDVPHAEQYLARFIARGILDELMNKDFLCEENQKETQSRYHILEQVKQLIFESETSPPSSIKFVNDQVWGIGNGRPVQEFKKDIDLLIQEYLVSNDVGSLASHVGELDSAYLQHEVVKRILLYGMDSSLTTRQQLWQAVSLMSIWQLLSKQQIMVGFQQMFENLADLALDTPRAEQVLMEYAHWAQLDKLLDESEVAQMIV